MKNLKYMAVAALLACGALNASAKDNVEYVDPFIGTTNFSICNPGAIRPHGLMSVVPFNVMGSDLNVQDKDKRWWSACYVHTPPASFHPLAKANAQSGYSILFSHFESCIFPIFAYFAVSFR